jgi:predicted transcriptional regulator
MKTENPTTTLEGTDETTSLTNTINQSEQNCRNCHPLTPLTCITDCKIWEQKNEIRVLYEKMKNPNFMTTLLNTLKNKRRIQILDLISKSKQIASKLQKELKTLGYYHSQQTIIQEYIMPLVDVGLAREDQNLYSATLFGRQTNEIIKNNQDIGDILPAHSECYEEVVLDMTLNKPKTYDGFEGIIPAKSIARILNRLQKVNLMKATEENDYVFFFQTKRDSRKAEFSPTEERIYQNIPEDGISARGLSDKTRISLRRTYKYLRRLKGKKLVFTRKRPKIYALTTEGVQLASMLRKVHDLTLEAFKLATQTVNRDEKGGALVPNSRNGKKERRTIPLMTMQYIE